MKSDLDADTFAADHGNAVDVGTIAWLLPEIVTAFDAATIALRAFRAGAAGVDRTEVDLGSLRVARSHLHQAHGALELSELAGVVKLTEAMEELLGAFEKDPSRCDALALDAIVGGCRSIVEYLEDLQGGAPAQPLHLFPSYRDLLTARKADRIHPADLFTVDVGVRPPRDDEGRALDAAGLAEQRRTFEQGLLHYMRNDGDLNALVALESAVTAIDRSVAKTAKSGHNQQRAFWWVARALFEALAHEGFARQAEQHTPLKRLAGRINLQIRKLAEGSGAVAERLFADTLFFVAIAAPVTQHVRDVQAAYRLADAVPKDYETQRYGRIDAIALKRAREALTVAKTAWSSVVAGDTAQIPVFAKEAGALLDAVRSIKRRGLVQVASVVDGIATDLGFDPRQPSPPVGLDVATALLFLEGALDRARSLDESFDQRAALVVARVEASALGQDAVASPIDWLDRMSREAEERLTNATFVVELQASLRNAEKVLDAFFREPTHRADLPLAQAALAQVSGALALLGHDDVHRAIDHARATVARFERDDVAADPVAFESLASSLGAVGFYVEQIKRDRVDSGMFRFDPASGSFSADLARSGSAVPPPRADLEAVEAVEAPADAFAATMFLDSTTHDEAHDAASVAPGEETNRSFMATEILEPEASLEDEIVRGAGQAGEAAARWLLDVDDFTAQHELEAALEDVRGNAGLIDDRALQDAASGLLTALRASHAGPPADLASRVARLGALADRSAGIAPPSATPERPGAAVPSADNVAAVDAELLDIFLEEATGVLADATASMRVLDADPENVTAATNLRRGFHTLKGSSRMVGLFAFGDAAWSIEETLTGHLVEAGAASNDLRALIDHAIRYLSDWLEELQAEGTSSRVPDALIEAARALRSSGTPVAASPAQPIALETPPGDDDFEQTLYLPRDASAFQDVGASPSAGPIESPDATPIDDPWADDAAVASESVVDASPVVMADEFAEASTDPLAPTRAPAVDHEVTGSSAAAPEVPEPAPTAANNVVPFGSPSTQPVAAARTRSEDVRQVGPLTLSLALFNIYLTEADELLRVLTQDFAEWRHELHRYVSEDAMRAAHSLAGSSATVGLVPAHDLASAVEDVLMALWRDSATLNEEQVIRLQDAVESLRRMLHRFAAERFPDPDPVRIAGLLALRREVSHATDASGASGASALPFEPLDFDDAPEAEPSIASEAQVPEGQAEADDPFADFVFEEDAAPSVEDDAVISREADADVEAPLQEAASIDAIETLPDLSFIDTDATPRAGRADASIVEPAARESIDAPSHVHEQPELETVDADAIAAARRAAALLREAIVRDDIDPDLVEVFVAEAGEILPQVSTLFRTWQASPDDPAPARMLLRLLHTLKGSARMAGAMRLGEVVHEIETRIEAAARLPTVSAPLIDELLAAHDRSLELFEEVQHPQPQAAAVVAGAVDEPPVATVDAGPDDPAATASVEAMQHDDAFTTPAMPRPRDQQHHQKQPVQQVRVNSDTLDRLVNLAGEVSISRARIENEVQQIKGAMSDLSENVERLRGQLREIELQAEFQMQSRMQSQQVSGAEREKFDPLEFDRFTRFQELTRMMAESVNDVKTVQQTLARSLDSADTDLATQRRMTRDLQQDLMQVRMVPFASVAERLYRVARRSAKELDKRVNVDIRGNTVEIDRGVLERMTGPFEHLLRNHIVHGIETREARRASGKAEAGELLIEVRQEGNEIVLTFSDDGAGLDHDRIRAKGRELGLIGDGPVSDAQAAELIFHPGFSTVDEITELAGRGVGMDVVRAEAQQLGGRVSVDSTRGQGSRFTIRLPLTLAITQVVLVAVADRVYALPAMLVEHVEPMPSQRLADAHRAGHVDWADAPIRLAFLGDLLGIDDAVPVVQAMSPVLILRSAGERMAVHVDEVVANQEVVVKNLGPQLARMAGIVGATVLGSGDIVLILNPVQLAQLAGAQKKSLATPAATRVATPAESAGRTMPTVMVVDDSLTVRRVTQRLLSREGYQVVLAKDGVDALEQLPDVRPDVMLVDIEMPRMDGFDLTRNLRADDRYKHIPIIMITSRTAEKHRRHAAELGVDAYLGKPYQEDELLDLLVRHVTASRAQETSANRSSTFPLTLPQD